MVVGGASLTGRRRRPFNRQFLDGPTDGPERREICRSCHHAAGQSERRAFRAPGQLYPSPGTPSAVCVSYLIPRHPGALAPTLPDHLIAEAAR